MSAADTATEATQRFFAAELEQLKRVQEEDELAQIVAALPPTPDALTAALLAAPGAGTPGAPAAPPSANSSPPPEAGNAKGGADGEGIEVGAGQAAELYKEATVPLNHEGRKSDLDEVAADLPADFWDDESKAFRFVLALTS